MRSATRLSPRGRTRLPAAAAFLARRPSCQRHQPFRSAGSVSKWRFFKCLVVLFISRSLNFLIASDSRI